MPLETILFSVEGTQVVGHLFIPDGPGPFPAIVVAGPMTSVKEQVTGTYAKALADRGFAGLALDHRNFGESGGLPRQYEHVPSKIADLVRALDIVADHPKCDSERLGILGVCLGAGYAAWAAIDSPRVRAFAGIAGYYRDPMALRQKNPTDYDAKTQQGVTARLAFERTGTAQIIPAAALHGDAAMQTEDTVDYYTRRANIPPYKNEFAVMSREFFLPFDVQAAAPRLNVPAALVHAETALSPTWARTFYTALPGRKNLTWVDARSQTAFYDTPSLVALATDQVTTHFNIALT